MISWLTPELISVILGVIVPFVTSLLKNCDWSRETKTLLAGAVSAVFAVGGLVATGDLTLVNFGTNLPIVFASATAFYNLYFKDTTTDKKLSQAKLL